MSRFEELAKQYSELRSRETKYLESSIVAAKGFCAGLKEHMQAPDSWTDIDPETGEEKGTYQYIYFIIVDDKGEQVQQPFFNSKNELLTKIVVTIEPAGQEKMPKNLFLVSCNFKPMSINKCQVTIFDSDDNKDFRWDSKTKDNKAYDYLLGVIEKRLAFDPFKAKSKSDKKAG